MKGLSIVLTALLLVGCEWEPASSSGSGGVEVEVSPPDSDPIVSESMSGSGVLWKPVSESNGNLVVLLASSFSHQTVQVVSVNSGTVFDTGRYVGRTNGNRPTYRFSRTGAAYPSPCALKVGDRYFYIPSSGSRHE